MSAAFFWLHDAVDNVRVKTPATIVGPFAVHRGYFNEGWTLSHVQSGGALRTKLPTKRAAMDLARALRAVDFDWTRITTKNGAKYFVRNRDDKAVKAITAVLRLKYVPRQKGLARGGWELAA